MGQVFGKSGSVTGNVSNAIQSMSNMSSRSIAVGRVFHRLNGHHKECVKLGKPFKPNTKGLWSEVNEVERYRHTGACMMPHIADNAVLHVRTTNLGYHRGDVVVMTSPAPASQNADTDSESAKGLPKALLRRIAAVPGDVLTRRTATEGGDGLTNAEVEELILEDGKLWVSKDNLEAEGVDSSDFGPVSKDLVIGCAVRIGEPGNNLVLNSTETLEIENNAHWVPLNEIEDVVRRFETFAESPESEQALKDSLGFFKGADQKRAPTQKKQQRKDESQMHETQNAEGRETLSRKDGGPSLSDNGSEPSQQKAEKDGK